MIVTVEGNVEDKECQGLGSVGGVVAILYIEWYKKGLLEGSKGVSHVEIWKSINFKNLYSRTTKEASCGQSRVN